MVLNINKTSQPSDHDLGMVFQCPHYGLLIDVFKYYFNIIKKYIIP